MELKMYEDLIRRSDAIKKIKWWFDLIKLNPDILIDSIITLPTIEPKRERCEYCKDGSFIGQKKMLGNDGTWHRIFFCPNCGAEMKGADDERL